LEVIPNRFKNVADITVFDVFDSYFIESLRLNGCPTSHPRFSAKTRNFSITPEKASRWSGVSLASAAELAGHPRILRNVLSAALSEQAIDKTG
jgi:hypothetical protein